MKGKAEKEGEKWNEKANNSEQWANNNKSSRTADQPPPLLPLPLAI